MNAITRALKYVLLERPFDLYVLFLLLLVGTFSIVSGKYPENLDRDYLSFLANVISIYYIVASIVVAYALVLQQTKKTVRALVVEMYGWMFISAAAAASAIIAIGAQIQRPPSALDARILFDLVWIGLFVFSGLKSWGIFRRYRGTNV